jgi:hypothetical protein
LAPFDQAVSEENIINISQSETRIALGGIEHMLKLHVFGNNSKTINNIRNLTGEKLSAQQDLTTLKL